ncbi:TPA: hypothetical protein EYH33_00600 [Candidatus Bipolaricaulota bacterium]|nr:hypothetical protein [Candidatus Bipolaricaulota bacterium]
MGPEYLHIDPEAPDAFEKELEKRKAFISEMVARYQPEYLELPRGPTGWRALLQMLPDIRRWLDEVSPATKIVMLTGPVYDYQVEEFNAYVDSPYVDIAAVHLVELIYPSYRARLEEMARYARSRGKSLWSTDTWLSDGGWAYHGPGLTPEGYEPFTFETMIEWLHQGEYPKVLEKLDLPWREPLDAGWQRAVVYYAQRLGFESVSPFHVQYFVDYDPSFYTPLDADITSWRESLDEERHTHVFHAYQEIIREVRQRCEGTEVFLYLPLVVANWHQPWPAAENRLAPPSVRPGVSSETRPGAEIPITPPLAPIAWTIELPHRRKNPCSATSSWSGSCLPSLAPGGTNWSGSPIRRVHRWLPMIRTTLSGSTARNTWCASPAPGGGAAPTTAPFTCGSAPGRRRRKTAVCGSARRNASELTVTEGLAVVS